MITLPDDILAQYEVALKKRAIAAYRRSEYRKWLRYYLDFCAKYQPPNSKSERVRLFIEKLRKKKQTPEQQQQAGHAVSLYFDEQKGKMTPSCLPLRLNALRFHPCHGGYRDIHKGCRYNYEIISKNI